MLADIFPAGEVREGYIKKIPFANPASVSIFPRPYGYLVLEGHLLITAAQTPTPRARQSKNICTLSLIRPRDPVRKPYKVCTIMKTKLRHMK